MAGPMMNFGTRLESLADRHLAKAVLVLLAVFVAVEVLHTNWRQLQGYEPEWVAQALVSGHGYSFDGAHRWLFESSPPDQYFPTAWTDPLFTLFYAALIYCFDNSSRPIMGVLSLVFFVVCAILTLLTAKRLGGSWAALIALTLLLVNGRSQAIAINASSLAGLWIALVLFYFVKHAERLTLRLPVVLGGILGLSVLTWSSTMVLVPVVALLVFWFAPAVRPGLKMAAVTLVIPVVLVSPWTLRNYVALDEFVPVRTGLGHLAHIGTVGLANTIAPERVSAPVPPPWTATGPFEAVARATAREHVTRGVQWDRRALEAWQRQVLATEAGATQDDMNEAQRDKWYLREAQAFLVTEPLLAAQLGAAKLTRFVFHGRWPRISGLTAVVAVLVGSVLALRRRLLIVPIALAVAYSLPFTVIVAYFYRYRYPIEPVLAVLASVALAYAAQIVLREAPPRLGSWRRRGGHGRALSSDGPGAGRAQPGGPLPHAERDRVTGPTSSGAR